MLKEYNIEIIFWEDHYTASGFPPEDVDDITPTLSLGLILEETEKVLVLAHDIERYSHGDQLTYTVILKDAIVGRKVYGSITLEEPQR